MLFRLCPTSRNLPEQDQKGEPLTLPTLPWAAARQALRAAASILSIGAGVAALGLLHGIEARHIALQDYLLTTALPAVELNHPRYRQDRRAAAHRSGTPLTRPVSL